MFDWESESVNMYVSREIFSNQVFHLSSWSDSLDLFVQRKGGLVTVAGEINFSCQHNNKFHNEHIHNCHVSVTVYT